jgi:CrcB protein
MTNVLLVGIGGFLGSAARYLITGVVTQASATSRFPLGTLMVNLLGCLAIGAVAGLAERADLFSAQTRLFLVTGILGGFTTFSAFAFETYFLGREHQWMPAMINVVAQVALGLAAVWVGHQLAAGSIQPT